MTEVDQKKLLCLHGGQLEELKHQHMVHYYNKIIDRSNTMEYIAKVEIYPLTFCAER